MEKQILDIENEFNMLENKNISLYMKNVRNIKKNICKLEINLNKLCKECSNNIIDDNDDNSDSDDNIEIENIDKYLDMYCSMLNSINDENVNNKTIEELLELSKQLELMEKNIKIYQKSNNELNIINL
jgi:hypothetical protein